MPNSSDPASPDELSIEANEKLRTAFEQVHARSLAMRTRLENGSLKHLFDAYPANAYRVDVFDAKPADETETQAKIVLERASECM